jgi:signal transduction histidine kinase
VWPVKLEYKVTLLIFAVLLVVGVPGGALMLHLQREGLKSQFEETALTVAETLYDSLTSDMQSVRRDHIQDTVTRASAGATINEVVVLSSTQKVYASGEISEIGQTRNDEYIALALETGETVTRTEEQYGRTEVCVVLPVFNAPQCHGCHDDDKVILGAIEVGLDRSSLDAQIRDQTMIMGLIAGLTFVTVGGSLAFMFRSTVAGPLSRLGGTARRIAEGDFAARAEADARDEVGMLARTFNEMADHMEEYAGALEESKRDLEQKVQDRTAQLLEMATIRGQLLERLISAQEEERRRIARELHDEAGQALTMMMMDLARAADALPEGATEAREKLTQSRALAAQTLAELRKMIYDLRPEVLDQLGLVPAMRSYVRSRLEAENVKTRLRFVGLDQERLSPEVEITLFRIVQEAVTNIIRHSGASEVDIEVVRKGSIVTATVSDDGKGFDAEAALQAPESWGLRGIRERVAVVGGELSIESGPGRGTRIRISIPVPDEQEFANGGRE